MKQTLLGEALAQRKYSAARLKNLADQLATNSFGHISEDRASGRREVPAAPEINPMTYAMEMVEAADAHAKLVARIDNTNATTTLEFNKRTLTLTEAVQLRERWKEAAALLAKAIPSKGSNIVLFVDVNELRNRVNQFARDARQIDIEIQRMNWSTILTS